MVHGQQGHMHAWKSYVMKHPLIGITTYPRNEQGRFASPAQYVDAVRGAGGVPVLLAPGETALSTVRDRLDGLILAGGGDIDPVHYGVSERHATIYKIDAERDQMELALVKVFLEAQRPILAICRGMQILNVALGGTLHPHLPEVYGERITHRLAQTAPAVHHVTIDAASRLSAVLQTTGCEPKSWHHQSIDRLADGFRVVARADDGVIEAVESSEHQRLLAVQWHPELTADHDPAQRRLFDWLIRVCREAVPMSIHEAGQDRADALLSAG